VRWGFDARRITRIDNANILAILGLRRSAIPVRYLPIPRPRHPMEPAQCAGSHGAQFSLMNTLGFLYLLSWIAAYSASCLLSERRVRQFLVQPWFEEIGWTHT
jgi:hypothetical protein